MMLDGAAAGGGGYVGARVPRRELPRLLSGRGRYIDDIRLPRMLHVAFLRSPYAHARILAIDGVAAMARPGVEAVYTGADINGLALPLVGIAEHRPGHKAAGQRLLADPIAVWQGQPVVAVVAASRAAAEDAIDHIEVTWEELPAVLDVEAAATVESPALHPELGGNVAFDYSVRHGDPDHAFAEAALVVSETFRFERQSAMTLEPRGLVVDYDPAEGSLTVHHSHQSPFQMQDVFSRHLDIPEEKVRVVSPDVGGGFGMKLNIYAEELAVAAIGKLLGRPIKFVADRLKSFVSDCHARDHLVHARLAVDGEGRPTAFEIDDLGAVGAYGMPMRFNVAEGMMAITSAGAPYALAHHRARTRSVYVNKNLVGMYRGVGIPIGCVVTEVLIDRAARALGQDPAAFRAAHYRPLASLPCTTPSGVRLETVSFHACLEKLLPLMDYEGLRGEQAELRTAGVYRGIGLSTFVEPTAYGPPYYGPSGARISVQDGCSLRLDPSGAVRCVTSITDQGQGTLTGIAQIIADTLGVHLDRVSVLGGDSAISPYGGGAWASRGMAVGGEAALKAARLLRQNILTLAATITQSDVADLTIVGGVVMTTTTGRVLMDLGELGKIGYFRQDTLPADLSIQLAVTVSHVANDKPYYMANGVQGCLVEVDTGTGLVTVLGHWAVDDCGRVVNPLLVDEQVRGGIAQGIGAVLFEECMYDESGNMGNASLADYLVPMSGDVPDIAIAHVETRELSTDLGAKGVGEAGLIGAMGAVWTAVNDALLPLGARIAHQPFTPERILDAIADAQRPASGSIR